MGDTFPTLAVAQGTSACILRDAAHGIFEMHSVLYASDRWGEPRSAVLNKSDFNSVEREELHWCGEGEKLRSKVTLDGGCVVSIRQTQTSRLL